MNRIVYVILILAFYGLLALAISTLAASWDLPSVWRVLSIQCLLSSVAVVKIDPELLSERLRPKGKDQDPLGRPIISLLFLLHYGLAIIDLSKWHYSDQVPNLVQSASLLAIALGWSGFFWSMQVNKFFSSAIRLQPDRGQSVVSVGPYKWIRHPGYAFASLAMIFDAPALGSWISILPQILLVAYLIYRTQLEEKLLMTQLDGYKEYAQKVRFRWLPGIW
ncbi:MAG: isoprenylcysteine carboxylmethyltransferase family protein [Candidatus Obscuribacterales bacterium]|nr:isoprenylcysteine carboxylmethyltransferase family protein [Candidatus Obscuribacterales bacterium]